jgi:Xaa-Pro aminopeptidase
MIHNRIARVREEIQKRGLDALIVSSIFNIRYLTGFTGSSAVLVITKRSAIFLSDIRYTLQAKQEVQNCSRIIITKIGLYDEASKRKLLGASNRVGFESHQITYAQYRTLRKLFPSVSFASTSDIVEGVMLSKDEHEIDLICRAVKISDKVFDEILKIIRPDVSELEVAAKISYLHKSFGAERDAFETIVASGERSAFPHARASQKKIKSGELVTLDFGCVVGGYNCDITRTIAVGKPNIRAKRMYDVVREAQQSAIESAKAGMWAKELDAVARRSIERRGYGKYFNHSLGHGIGLNVHERPKVSQLSKEQLRAGSVITIEPGVYIPEVGGVRIEDDVLLTARGCEVLNEATKEFIVV